MCVRGCMWVGEERGGACGVDLELFLQVIVACGKHCQVESLAGVAHLCSGNGCVLLVS